jgi:hypothetical protein
MFSGDFPFICLLLVGAIESCYAMCTSISSPQQNTVDDFDVDGDHAKHHF